MEETLATMVDKRKDKEKAPQTSETQEATSASATPATQADIAKIYEKVMQLLLHTTTPTQTPPPSAVPTPNVSYLNFQKCNPLAFEGGPDLVVAEAWIRDLENIFRALRYPYIVKMDMVFLLLRKNTEFW